jgi:Family of unknown function (DUF6335)
MKRPESETAEELPHYDLSGLDQDELSKQNLAEVGAERTKRELEEHHSTSPALTGGDMDADWQRAQSVGDEAVGGHAPTPDQSVVDEIGQAVGFDAEDGEELHTVEERAAQRDRNRWELDRRSAADDTDVS